VPPVTRDGGFPKITSINTLQRRVPVAGARSGNVPARSTSTDDRSMGVPALGPCRPNRPVDLILWPAAGGQTHGPGAFHCHQTITMSSTPAAQNRLGPCGGSIYRDVLVPPTPEYAERGKVLQRDCQDGTPAGRMGSDLLVSCAPPIETSL